MQQPSKSKYVASVATQEKFPRKTLGMSNWSLPSIVEEKCTTC